MVVSEKRLAQNFSRGDAICANFMHSEKLRYQRKGYGLLVATTIAILFFYSVPRIGRLVWPSLLQWQADNGLNYAAFLLLLNQGIHNLINIVANLTYWVFYHYEIPFIERYKSNDQPWPWKADPEAWRKLVKKSIALSAFNMNVIPVVAYKALDHFDLLEEHAMDADKIPSSVTLAITIAFFMFCEDFTFYFAHRFLHWRVIYPHIHKIHHTHSTTVSIAAEYAHPVEFLLSNMLPSAVGPMLLGQNVHMVTIVAWYIVRTGETLDGHCGYEFSWSPFRLIPFSASAEYHDFHHSANVGNFASFFQIWDSVFGTNEAFFDHLKEKEAEQEALYDKLAASSKVKAE